MNVIYSREGDEELVQAVEVNFGVHRGPVCREVYSSLVDRLSDVDVVRADADGLFQARYEVCGRQV